MNPPAYPQFLHHGATDGVTGSCHRYIARPDVHLLVDCGLFQGVEAEHNGTIDHRIRFDLVCVRALVVTHVHIDHIGRLPYLLAAGFKGPILCSVPSARLLPLVIEDAMKIVKSELENDGIFIEKLDWVNAIRLPQQIVEALNSKVQATQEAQKVENEIAKAKAQAEIRLVEARAKAQENNMKQGAMTHAVLMEKWIEKWDGKLPTVVSDKSMIQMPNN